MSKVSVQSTMAVNFIVECDPLESNELVETIREIFVRLLYLYLEVLAPTLKS